jgi:hypothetical protein
MRTSLVDEVRGSVAARIGAALTALGLGLVACSDTATTEASGGSSDERGASNEASGGSSSGGAGAPADPPPEREVESDYEAPVATGSFVWVANPKSGRVAYVDAATLQVRTIEAGNGPTYVSSVPGQAEDTTLVLNVLSEDATLLRASKTGGITAKTFDTAARANSVAFSLDGRYAIAWSDARKIPGAPRTDGFQDLTVLDLAQGTSKILAVGYRPVAVGFAAGTSRAFAVTQDGIDILDLAAASGPSRSKNVPISDAPNEDPGTRDVIVTKDGAYAFVRREGQSQITAVALETGTRTAITLPGPVTDLDLNDAGDRAVAVIRSTSQAAVLPIPQIASAPTAFTTVTLTGEAVGSVAIAPGGARALLYTNATPALRLSILELGTAQARTVRLYAPVLAVFATPDAQHAVVFHDKTSGSGSSTSSGSAVPSADAPGAFSLVPIGQVLPAKIVTTQALPTAVAFTNDRAIIAERDDKRAVYGAYLARMPELMVDRLPLASPPFAVGVVLGAKRAFVAQQHPEGRMTFVDLDTGVARTLTGFELASRVVDGSKP